MAKAVRRNPRKRCSKRITTRPSRSLHPSTRSLSLPLSSNNLSNNLSSTTRVNAQRPRNLELLPRGMAMSSASTF